MRILLTGATGFLGSHMTRALIDAGHEVRLMVRLPDRIEPALTPLGLTEALPYAIGDVTDAAAVGRAVEGCEAVVHAASVYSLDPRDAGAISRANVTGTRNVLDAALAAHIDPIVHISSYGALLPAEPDATLDADTRPSTGVGPYSASKADAERLVRIYQAAGNPIISVMPGSLWGPHDPHFGESHRLACNFLKGRMRLLNRGGSFPITDVRDVGAAVAACVEPGHGPRRYLVAGTAVSPRELGQLLSEVTGTRRRSLVLPDGLVSIAGAPLGVLQRISPWRLPLSAEAIRIATTTIGGFDDSRANEELGFTVRPIKETLTDTVRSLSDAGRLRREAGVLSASSAAG